MKKKRQKMIRTTISLEPDFNKQVQEYISKLPERTNLSALVRHLLYVEMKKTEVSQ